VIVVARFHGCVSALTNSEFDEFKLVTRLWFAVVVVLLLNAVVIICELGE
jgi:hypothetical protein